MHANERTRERARASMLTSVRTLAGAQRLPDLADRSLHLYATTRSEREKDGTERDTEGEGGKKSWLHTHTQTSFIQ